MKKIITYLCILLQLQLNAQNVGIKTTSPLSALDINGDLALRKGTLTLPAGGNNNVDITSSKYSVYDFAGGALTGGVQIYGFAGGTDGRIITIFNNTIGAVQLADESQPGSISSLAANRIITGSGNNAGIYQNGSVTLRYDAQKQRWIIIGSNYTDGLSVAGTNLWSTSGTNILNTNTGNVGIGEPIPTEKLHVNNGNIKIGKNLWASSADDRKIMFGDNDYVHIGEVGDDDKLELKGFTIDLNAGLDVNFNTQAVRVPTGRVGINTTALLQNRLQIGNPVAPFGGNDICIGNGVQTMSITQTSQAATWFSNNNFSFMPVGSGLGNVGIGTTNPGSYKLAVNGNIRAKEVVVETGWADYVFDNNYSLPSLESVEQYIKANKHLPNIPAAEEIQKNGLRTAELQTKMMAKIEELTLYVIALKKEIEKLKNK